jgi:hypothetical protein
MNRGNLDSQLNLSTQLKCRLSYRGGGGGVVWGGAVGGRPPVRTFFSSFHFIFLTIIFFLKFLFSSGCLIFSHLHLSSRPVALTILYSRRAPRRRYPSYYSLVMDLLLYGAPV